MSLLLRLRLAKQRGEAILSEEKLTKLAVDPFEIAARHDIIVQAKPDTASGVSGMLLRHGNSFGILYASDIPNEGFQRFSVAHELGHYFLDGHIDHHPTAAELGHLLGGAVWRGQAPNARHVGRQRQHLLRIEIVDHAPDIGPANRNEEPRVA